MSDFITQAARALEAERNTASFVDGAALLRRAAQAVAEVNRESQVAVTVTDYAILVLADAIARSRRSP